MEYVFAISRHSGDREYKDYTMMEQGLTFQIKEGNFAYGPRGPFTRELLIQDIRRNWPCGGEVNQDYLFDEDRTANDVFVLFENASGKFDFLGFVLAYKDGHQAVYLDVICSKPGFGQKVLKGFIHFAMAFGATQVRLSSLPNVLRFYPRFKFEYRNSCADGPAYVPESVIAEADKILPEKRRTIERQKAAALKAPEDLTEEDHAVLAAQAQDAKLKKDTQKAYQTLLNLKSAYLGAITKKSQHLDDIRIKFEIAQEAHAALVAKTYDYRLAALMEYLQAAGLSNQYGAEGACQNTSLKFPEMVKQRLHFYEVNGKRKSTLVDCLSEGFHMSYCPGGPAAAPKAAPMASPMAPKAFTKAGPTPKALLSTLGPLGVSSSAGSISTISPIAAPARKDRKVPREAFESELGEGPEAKRTEGPSGSRIRRTPARFLGGSARKRRSMRRIKPVHRRQRSRRSSGRSTRRSARR